MSERKIGAGHLAAMARLGLKELRNAANPSRDSIADTEVGLYGTQTQGEIAAARGSPSQGPEEENSEKKSGLEKLRDKAKALIGAKSGPDQSHGHEQDSMER